MPESVGILVPTGMLGGGFSPETITRGLRLGADVIAVDGGSTHSGAHYPRGGGGRGGQAGGRRGAPRPAPAPRGREQRPDTADRRLLRHRRDGLRRQLGRP